MGEMSLSSERLHIDKREGLCEGDESGHPMQSTFEIDVLRGQHFTLLEEMRQSQEETLHAISHS